MIRYLFILISLLLCSLSYAQLSTEIVGKAMSNKDTAYIEGLIRAAKAHSNNKEMKIGMSLLFESLEKGLLIGYKGGIGEACYRLGFVYTVWDQYDSALLYLLKAIPYCKEAPHKQHLLAEVYNSIGYIFYQKGAYHHALEYFESSETVLKTVVYPGSKRVLVTTLNNISSIHDILQQYDKALYFNNKAEQICRESSFNTDLSAVLGNKASIYKKLNKIDTAEKLYLASIELSKQMKTHNEIFSWVTAKLNLASLKLDQQKPREALALIDDIARVDATFHQHITALGPAYMRGLAYLHLDRYKEAEQYLIKALQESFYIANVDRLADIHKSLSALYDSSGNFKKALKHHYAYTALKDSLLGRERIKDINEIDAKYRIAEKDKQLAIAQKKASEKNMWIAISYAGILMLLGIIFMLYRQVKHKRKLYGQREEIQKLKDIMKGEERERTRIAEELHDGIGGMLAALKMNISNLSLEAADPHRSKAIREALLLAEETAQEVRRTSHNLIPKILEMHNLEEALALYCDNISRTTGIVFSLQVNGGIDTLSKAIELLVYRMVQELTQNIVKHAQATMAYVQVSLYEQTITIAVEDNGTGIDSAQVHDGIGLKNLQYRVAALEGTMSIDSVKGKNTVVVIEFERDKLEVLT